MPNLSDKLSGLTYTPKPQSPMRAGCIMQVASDSVTEWTSRNWFECDGSEYPESTYAELFTAIGTKYNTGGETASHFRVPNGPRRTVEVDMDVTSGASGWSLTEAVGVVYQDALGRYRVKGNIQATLTSASSVTASISGLSWGIETGTTSVTNATGVAGRAFTSGANSIIVDVPSGSTNLFRVAFDIQLSTKPTDSFVGADSRFSTFDESLESIPVIKVYNDEGTVSVSTAPATATTLGTVKLNSEYAATASQYGLVQSNRILYKSVDSTYNTNTTSLLTVSNVPQGLFKVIVGSDYYYGSVNNAEALILPQLNGSNILIPGTAGSIWHVGHDDDASTETENYLRGYSSILLIDFPNVTNSFELDIQATGGGIVSRPWYILEKLENVTEISTEWD